MSPNNSIMDNVANVANEGLDTLTDTMSNIGVEIKETVKENLDAILSTPSSAITMDNLVRPTEIIIIKNRNQVFKNELNVPNTMRNIEKEDTNYKVNLFRGFPIVFNSS